MQILIIEDEKKTASYLAKGLKESGFIVDVSHDGEEGLYFIRENHYDLIILDVMLPKVDGWTLITRLKRIQPETRVLFLTARDTISDKVKGFELGADDYLVKPFSFSELLGRVKALLRRNISPKTDTINIADLEINLIKHSVKRDKQSISLTPQEFSLLLFLARHPGEVLSRTRIVECVWDIHFNTDTNIVDTAIKRLRQKIDGQFETKLIHTVRGVGYVLEAR